MRRSLPMLRELVGPLRRGLSWARRGETDRTCFDPFNPRELNPVLAANGVAPLSAQRAPAAPGQAGTARVVLGLYAGSGRLRRRFPRAFAEDQAGPFCQWLLGRLSTALAENVVTLFADNYGSRVARVWEAHPDLRAALPFALTPFERGKFLSWLLTDARPRYQLSDEEILWHLFELTADPSCGLERTYRFAPEWQEQVPDALSATGWEKLKEFVGRQMGFVSRWLRRASLSLDAGWASPPRPADQSCSLPPKGGGLGWGVAEYGVRRTEYSVTPHPGPPPQGGREKDTTNPTEPRSGVNLLGYFRYTSGLQQVALTMAQALERAGVPARCRDVPTQCIREPSGREPFDGLETFATTVVNLPIDLRLGEVYRRAGLWPRPGVRRIATAWWELEQVPPELAGWAADYDALWAPTRFIAGALGGVTAQPVRVMLPGLELPPVNTLPKEHFGLDPGAFTFLFVFDFNSRMPRKNPLGLIRAFRRAFKRSEPAQLVIKASAGDERFREHRRLLQEIADREGVHVIDALLPRGALLSLTACCDCYVSLHRSEGFGLTIAEAMLLAKPAIATGYSGNLDFMTPDNSRLVDFTTVPIVDDIPPYPKGFRWAEPSVEHAAELMRWMYEHPAEARALGEQGRDDLRRLLSIDAYGRRLALALHG